MNDLIPFDHPEFGQVRIHLDERGEPWWVAADVCRVLELANTFEALRTLNDDEKITIRNPDSNTRAGIPHSLTLINKLGLLRLIRSRDSISIQDLMRRLGAKINPEVPAGDGNQHA